MDHCQVTVKCGNSVSDTIIRVENLGKKYIIGHQQEGRSNYVALRDVIANTAKSLVKRFTQPSQENPNKEEFWALKDVSFEIKKGECVGIIGRNGAGKSTLLKILSRITEPTIGRVSLKGRVASLLEVGTGFHPELTGRENIYLNGAILGMSRAEIKKKFDEIVAFAEVEKFLDTPVKRYSSGMYVRLAFAVAAHLEPEILVVDEVLAVGDAAFQKKCLGKMGDVATKEGRTVLFVSHNMAAVNRLCFKGIYLEKGTLKLYSNINQVIDYYIQKNLPDVSFKRVLTNDYREGNRGVKLIIHSVEIVPNKNGILTYKDSLKVLINLEAKKKLNNLAIGLGVAMPDGTRLLTVESPDEMLPNILANTQLTLEVNIIHPGLTPGTYVLAVGARNINTTVALDYISNAIIFDVVDASKKIIASQHGLGLRPDSNWKLVA